MIDVAIQLQIICFICGIGLGWIIWGRNDANHAKSELNDASRDKQE